MRNFMFSLTLLFFSAAVLAQSATSIDYTVKMLPGNINLPGSANGAASMDDAGKKLVFVRTVNAKLNHFNAKDMVPEDFPAIYLSEKDASGNWKDPVKIYPKNKTVKWKEVSNGWYSQKGSITYPDYQLPEQSAFNTESANPSMCNVTISHCKINRAGNSIFFAIHFKAEHIDNTQVCTLNLATDNTWTVHPEQIEHARGITEIDSNGELVLCFEDYNSRLYGRDKLGKFSPIKYFNGGLGGVLASDNQTWLYGWQDLKFERYMDYSGEYEWKEYSGPTHKDIGSYFSSSETLNVREGKIHWISRDLRTGFMTIGDPSQLAQFNIDVPITFEESQYVRMGKIRPWRGAAPTSVKTNPVSTVSTEARFVRPTGKYYALIMGVSRYDDPELGNLGRPSTDATAFKNLLTSKYEFEPGETTLLLDPTREQILSELGRLRRVIGQNDNLLIFYAGHGKFDESAGQGYWIPRNGFLNNSANWISNSDIKEQIRAIQSGHTLLISDACFSGALFRTRGTESLRTAGFDIKTLYKMPSRRAMTSGTMSSVPDNSVFFEYLSKRLSDNEEKFLPSTTLFESFRRTVINNSPTVVPQDGVITATGDEGGDFIFIKRD